MRSAKWSHRLACVTVATSGLVGCSHVIDGTAIKQPLAGEADCAEVSAPMSTIEPRHDGEPVMRIPQPNDWQRNTMLDSEIIRYVMSDVDLIANKFAPTAAVTLEDVTTHGGSAEEILAQEWASVEAIAGATDLVITSNQPVCGFPAQTATYNLPQMGMIPARSGIGLAVATPGVRKYAAMISVQTTEPDNPTYASDAKTIIDGFQILPEPSGDS